MALSSLTLQDKVEQLQISIFLVLEKAEKFLVLKRRKYGYLDTVK